MKFLKNIKDDVFFFFMLVTSYITDMFKSDDEMNG